MPPQQKSIASFFTKPKQKPIDESVEAKENEVPSQPPEKEAVDERETKKRRLVKNDTEKEPNQLEDENLEDLDDDMDAEGEQKEIHAVGPPQAPPASLPSPPVAVKKVASIFSKPEPKATAASPSSNTTKKDKPDPPSTSKSKSKPAVAKKAKDDDEDDDDDDDDEEEEEEAGPSDKRKKKSTPKKGGGSKVEGVGHGAIAAASKLVDADIPSLVGGRWKAGNPVPFEMLADTFEEIAGTTKRLEIVHLLINCFRAILSTTPQDLLPAIYLCTNKVAPAHFGIELGVGEGIILKAVAAATGRTESRIREALKEEGDLGTIAVKFKSSQKTLGLVSRLTIRGVFKAFVDIANVSGKSSMKQKEGLILKLLASSKGNETGYVVRSLQAKLRIGLADKSVLSSLAHAMLLHKEPSVLDDKSILADKLEGASQVVKMAFSECPSFDVMIPALLAHPLEELEQHCHFMPGVPVKPMLAKATNAVSEVIDKFQDCEFTCEYKYDGERAQFHILDPGSLSSGAGAGTSGVVAGGKVGQGKRVVVFSRNSENSSGKYPDVVSKFTKYLKPGVKSIVIDSEVVAYDPIKKRILPFQVLSTRKRKDVDMTKIEVPVCVFAFDCLFLNGKSLLREPLVERRRALFESLIEVEDEMQFATSKTSRDLEELQRFLDESVEGCTEGLIVKTLEDAYEPGARNCHWLKLKKDYLEGVGDTIDVVPIGAFHGKGKRTGVYGAYLLAIYDPESETYQTISKLGTGFSELVLSSLAEQMTPHLLTKPPKYYTWSETLEPDVWFEPAKVWEVKAADLSISPVHKAGQGRVDPIKGISIRFPRLIRVRDDKGPEDATTAEQIVGMYKAQALTRKDETAPGEGDEDDY